MERTPTNEQIEAEVTGHMQLADKLPKDTLLAGYRELLFLNAFLRRALIESVSAQKVIFIGEKGIFERMGVVTAPPAVYPDFAPPEPAPRY